MTTIYGIKNCDSVKKARKWLDEKQITYKFHDFRVDGLSKALVDQWLKKLGPEALINKRSTTWKQLSETEQKRLSTGSGNDLILLHPTLIKRPVLETKGTLELGFKAESYQRIFK